MVKKIGLLPFVSILSFGLVCSTMVATANQRHALPSKKLAKAFKFLQITPKYEVKTRRLI